MVGLFLPISILLPSRITLFILFAVKVTKFLCFGTRHGCI